MSDTGIIVKDSKHTIVRINNFILSYNINGSGLFDIDTNHREPTIDEYNDLWNITDEYITNYFQELVSKTTKHNNCTVLQYKSNIKSVSYCTDNIPNKTYQICVKYNYSDLYFTSNSILSDSLEVMAEGFLSKAIGRTKYVEKLRTIVNDDGQDSIFKAVEGVYFCHYGSNPLP